ncbi:unnamed protein product [Heterobilharzia americana]|nr:unnamed protein product [Heterobilharzia americana]
MLLSESKTNLLDIEKSESSEDPKQRMKTSSSPMKPLPRRIILDNENDDDDERLARRKSRLLEPHPASVSSPSANSSAKRRVDAEPPRGIPPAQIGEHYGNCIRLAAENKITAKNAFNLHLIDYMSEMIKKEDFTSFQIASSSLDAGAKIYAGRVDAVHQETYQVLTGLGRSGNPQNAEVESDTNNADENDDSHVQSKPQQKKKTAVHRDVIQKQLNKIRIKTLADKVDVDPLFQHQTAVYDDGGTAELRLNQLFTANASCELILDSSTPVMLRKVANTQPTTPMNITNVTEFLSTILTKSLNQLSICSTLQNFRFTDWNPNKNTFDLSDQINLDTTIQQVDPLNLEINDDDNGFDPLPSQDDSLDDNTIHEDVNLEPVFEKDTQVEVDGLSPKAVDSKIEQNAVMTDVPTNENTTTTTITTTPDSELFVASLKSMLDKQFEHFGKLNDHLLGMWAGPEHWRKKAKRPRLDIGVKSKEDNHEVDLGHAVDGDEIEIVKTVGNRKIKKSKKDKGQKVSYAEAHKSGENRTRSGRLCRQDWSNNGLAGVQNSATPNATVFKESYRQKVNREMNMLASECSDTRHTLYQLIHRDVILRSNLCNSRKPGEVNNNMNGNSDLCAVLSVGGTDRPLNVYDDDVNDGADDHLDNHQDDDDDDDILMPFECSFTQNTANNDGEVDGFELISQPNKVARIEIGYARTAKMINIQRLKFAMWGFLENTVPHVNTNVPSLSPSSVASTTSAPDGVSLTDDAACSPRLHESQQQQPMNECITVSDGGKTSCLPKVSGAKSLSEVIDSLSSRISWRMAKELSVSIALNCLLHLSNEKQLYLESVDSFSDIFISQGLPSFEMRHLESYANAYNNTPNIPSDKQKSSHQKRNKAKHMRVSTLDSWLVDTDSGE